MAEFQFDTSGAVLLQPSKDAPWETPEVRWSDLSPFVQGYIEAAFADFDKARLRAYNDAPRGAKGRAVPMPPAFRWLAPETLAQIMEYCGAVHTPLPKDMHGATQGRDLWRARQAGLLTFPPVTLSLNDAGKVVFK